MSTEKKIYPPGDPRIEICGLLQIGNFYSETLLVIFHRKSLLYVIKPYLYYQTPLRLDIIIHLKREGELAGSEVKVTHWDWSQQDFLCGELYFPKKSASPQWMRKPGDPAILDYVDRVLNAFRDNFGIKPKPVEGGSGIFNLSDFSPDPDSRSYLSQEGGEAWQQVWFAIDKKSGFHYAIHGVKELLGQDDEISGYRACLSSAANLDETYGVLLWARGGAVSFWPLGTHPGLDAPVDPEKIPHFLRNTVLL